MNIIDISNIRKLLDEMDPTSLEYKVLREAYLDTYKDIGNNYNKVLKDHPELTKNDVIFFFDTMLYFFEKEEDFEKCVTISKLLKEVKNIEK